ncbi:MAG: endonuclease/exonuclease/phosphatase family protein [Caldilineaceae bacterium]
MPTLAATDTLPEHSYGNAILSRWPIIASAAHHLTPVEGKEQRGLLEGRVLLPDGRPFTVYVTHIDHTDENARLTQLRAIRTWTVRDRNRPYVLMGDFNAISPWDYEARPDVLAALAQHPKGSNMVDHGKGPQVIPALEKAGYVDAMRLRGQAGQQTFLPAEDELRIDYIWVSEPLADGVHSAAVWPEPAGEEVSDHRPVLVEIEI